MGESGRLGKSGELFVRNDAQFDPARDAEGAATGGVFAGAQGPDVGGNARQVLRGGGRLGDGEAGHVSHGFDKIAALGEGELRGLGLQHDLKSAQLGGLLQEPDVPGAQIIERTADDDILHARRTLILKAPGTAVSETTYR